MYIEKKTKVQKNIAYVAFYISFFPQLIAGPIVRYADIAEQIYIREESFESFANGPKRFIVGLSKKGHPCQYAWFGRGSNLGNPANGNVVATAWLGAVCYVLQIFIDFRDIPIWPSAWARCLDLPSLKTSTILIFQEPSLNFGEDGISHSPHGSGTMYISLWGGNRTGNVYLHLCIVFLLTGMWHGASFNLIILGLWNGLFLVLERIFQIPQIRSKILAPFQHLFTLLIFLVGLVVFRSDNIPYALNYLGVMFGMVQPEDVGVTIWYCVYLW